MRRILITAVLVLSAVSLAGCTASNSTSSGDSVSLPSVGAPEVARDGGGAADSAGGFAGPDADKSGQVTFEDRKVITTGELNLTVESPTEAADEAVRIVEQSGGHIDQRTEQPPVKGDKGSARLTVRIPSAKLTATLDDLKALGTVQDSSISSQDVTAQARDLDARITALQTSVDRLLDLMSKATSTTDLITIESALSERQANLDALTAQKRSLDGQVELSTISVFLGSEADAPIETPDTFFSGLIAGWNAFVAVFAGALVVLGVLVPWIALAGVAGVIVLVIVRARARGKVTPEES